MDKLNQLIESIERVLKEDNPEGQWKRKVLTLKRTDTVDVYIVDGDYVRDHFKDDKLDNQGIQFAIGGHHFRYPFIAEQEIWLEITGAHPESLSAEYDLSENFVHEDIERIYMKFMKLDYETAHDYASITERAVRAIHQGKLFDEAYPSMTLMTL